MVSYCISIKSFRSKTTPMLCYQRFSTSVYASLSSKLLGILHANSPCLQTVRNLPILPAISFFQLASAGCFFSFMKFQWKAFDSQLRFCTIPQLRCLSIDWYRIWYFEIEAQNLFAYGGRQNASHCDNRHTASAKNSENETAAHQWIMFLRVTKKKRRCKLWAFLDGSFFSHRRSRELFLQFCDEPCETRCAPTALQCVGHQLRLTSRKWIIYSWASFGIIYIRTTLLISFDLPYPK